MELNNIKKEDPDADVQYSDSNKRDDVFKNDVWLIGHSDPVELLDARRITLLLPKESANPDICALTYWKQEEI